jgi:AcrR family transcriptional regulator
VSNLKLKTAIVRRQHILDAAIHVFEAQGFRGATIKDIAKQAGVADGTVYNVFENKEALLLGILESMLGSSQSTDQPKPQATANLDISALLQSMITNRWETQTPQMLAMMRIIWSEALVNRELATQYVNKIISPTLDGPLQMFEMLESSGAIASQDVPMMLRIVVSSFLGLALLRMLGDATLQERASEAPQHLANLLLNGLLPRTPERANHAAV